MGICINSCGAESYNCYPLNNSYWYLVNSEVVPSAYITKLIKGIPLNAFFKYYSLFKFSLCFGTYAWGASVMLSS